MTSGRAPSILTACAPPSLTKRSALVTACSGPRWERPVGHIGDQQRSLDAAPHRLDVVQHLLEGDRHGVVVAEDDHGERVAHQDDLGARGVDQAALRVVVGRHHGQAMIPIGCGGHPGGGDLLGEFLRRVALLLGHSRLLCVIGLVRHSSVATLQKRKNPSADSGRVSTGADNLASAFRASVWCLSPEGSGPASSPTRCDPLRRFRLGPYACSCLRTGDQWDPSGT